MATGTLYSTEGRCHRQVGCTRFILTLDKRLEVVRGQIPWGCSIRRLTDAPKRFSELGTVERETLSSILRPLVPAGGLLEVHLRS